MANFSFLTKYLDGSRVDVEEININSYGDVSIHLDSGKIVKSKEKFYSSDFALDVVKRILHKSGMIIDMSKPLVRGFLNKNVRITAIAPPLIDKDVGIVASIRIVNPKKLKREDFLKGQMANEEILDFLCILLRFGVSSCLVGSTGCGKTTLMSYILETIPNNKRIVTIEEGVREFNLVKKDENGEIVNNVVHLVTKHSDKESENVTSEDLVNLSLTLNPDILVVAEMKNQEAWAAQEAARTGHAVITTAHAKSAKATYSRLSTLCLQKYDIDFGIAEKLVREAFPIVVFLKKDENNKRHVNSIVECVEKDGKFFYNQLYRYVTDETDNINNVYTGHFEKVNDMSKGLQNELLENGASPIIIKNFLSNKGGV